MQSGKTTTRSGQAQCRTGSRPKAKAPVIVSKLDRLSRDVHFISGPMKHKVIVADLGADTAPFMLDTYAALAERAG